LIAAVARWLRHLVSTTVKQTLANYR